MQDEFAAATLDHLDALYGGALRLTRNAADAADLVQETFLRATRFQDRFAPGTNLRAWLFTIMTNMFINSRRRVASERRLEDADRSDAVIEAFVSSEALRMARSPERQFLSHVSSVEVREVVDRLSQDFRTVLLLADVEQFSYREIAEMVGCPIGTVMSRLFRARRLVQRMLIETDRTQEVAGAAAEPSRSKPTDSTGAIPIEQARRRRSQSGTRGGAQSGEKSGEQ